MKICVAGLGIIGGSICASLKRAGRAADGWNRSPLPLEYALNNGIIDGKVSSFLNYDVVFVALPPEATVKFIENTAFKNGAYVYDICGVKKPIETAVYRSKRNFYYVGTHPMAGKEISGIEAASETLFDGASMVITVNESTDKGALETICALTADMGFGRIVRCSAEVHDKKIAYTSQLAHIVSNAYVKDEDIDCCIGFTGGSFQDMTRIAGVDEAVWASLYLENAQNVSGKISSLIRSL
ncbi:MAG: prephenate dehydrogenase/arogenate dehydrogenase family protein, partial [Clostridia bacterium]|nr:prephenate dehydrogenase/arogenate dehydrogenase family protein [Clostridia bacterium]